ncbi:hypothetical protein DL93DRAFT_2144637 [Clavulina sp. PMI_390]|nr:hypothetical protein DL93DRAFT_2144637 [Clavulina sp. PMI_390]
MGASDLTVGYYRYSDIAFEWYHSFEDPSDMDAINAFLARDALVHPQHPFRKPGDRGAQLWMVTLYNGESRLCFSSAQVEYARYYVKAVGLVNHTLPLPSSHYLLTKSMINAVSPIYYTAANAIKKDLAKISKNNKKLKSTNDPRLHSMRLVFEHIRAIWAQQKATWIAIDFEAWELRHEDLTEFGYAMMRYEGEKQVHEEGHWIVKEREFTRNTQYVVDNKDHYEFGVTQSVKLKEFAQRIRDLIAGLNQLSGPLFIVFHDATGDMKYLQGQLAVPEAAIASRMIPDSPPADGIYVVDTAEMFAALEGHSGERRNLERMCRLLKLKDLKHMHNAGNDAHWTLGALREMASGPPLDNQREERWPAQTETNAMGAQSLKVRREQWEVDSDYDNLEGIYGEYQGVPDQDALEE